jgi:GNAT superfamily N-acetyltransferase
VAKHIQTSHLVGYCLGSPETDLDLFFNAQPYLVLFKDLFSQFPAHLHINFSSHYQGKGLGSKLLSAFEENLSSKKISGLHIMTASSARNVQFYRKMGFHLEVERPWGRGHILFMGKELKSK